MEKIRIGKRLKWINRIKKKTGNTCYCLNLLNNKIQKNIKNIEIILN